MYSTRPELLSAAQRSDWLELHGSCRPSAGPLLHPEFVAAVAAVRPDIEVGVLTDGGEEIGFLPFRRSFLDVARPVGGRLCDRAGAVVRRDARWSPLDFVAGAGLRALRLENTPTSDDALRAHQSSSNASRSIRLDDGFEAYRRAVEDSGSRLMHQIERRTRTAERRVGPMRFEWSTDDDGVFDTLFEWKATQRRATGSPDVFDLQWARELVDRLRRTNANGFRGLLSALYFGDTLAAAHFGVVAGDVLHYWVPAYNVELGFASPGLICLMEVARVGAERGVREICLGPGDQRFKLRAANHEEALATATVVADPMVGAALGAADRVRRWTRDSPAAGIAHRARQAVTRSVYQARAHLGSG